MLTDEYTISVRMIPTLSLVRQEDLETLSEQVSALIGNRLSRIEVLQEYRGSAFLLLNAEAGNEDDALDCFDLYMEQLDQLGTCSWELETFAKWRGELRQALAC